jgi:hypothetical protein
LIYQTYELIFYFLYFPFSLLIEKLIRGFYPPRFVSPRTNPSSIFRFVEKGTRDKGKNHTKTPYSNSYFIAARCRCVVYSFCPTCTKC